MILRGFQPPGSPKLQGRTGKPHAGSALQWTGMPTTVRSHAKINLGLYIGAPRDDGFHALVTVYQTIELHDLVTVTAHLAPTTSIILTSNDTRVPTDNRNTAWKMVSLALENLGAPAEVAIHIEKRLPIQGGLGAGSANAIAALIGLETELTLPGESPTESWVDRTQSLARSETWETKLRIPTAARSTPESRRPSWLRCPFVSDRWRHPRPRPWPGGLPPPRPRIPSGASSPLPASASPPPRLSATGIPSAPSKD